NPRSVGGWRRSARSFPEGVTKITTTFLRALAGGLALVDVLQDAAQVVAVAPLGGVRPELAPGGDVPDVVGGAGPGAVGDACLAAADLLAQLDGLEDRAVAVARAADVVHLADARVAVEVPEGVDQVVTVDVVADLLALVAVDRVGLAVGDAVHQVRQEAVQ